jgi:hypothetical protein
VVDPGFYTTRRDVNDADRLRSLDPASTNDDPHAPPLTGTAVVARRVDRPLGRNQEFMHVPNKRERDAVLVPVPGRLVVDPSGRGGVALDLQGVLQRAARFARIEEWRELPARELVALDGGRMEGVLDPDLTEDRVPLRQRAGGRRSRDGKRLTCSSTRRSTSSHDGRAIGFGGLHRL